MAKTVCDWWRLTQDADLDKVEGLEERGDEGCSEGEEVGDLVLECSVVVLVLLRGNLQVLLKLEQVFLVRE
jgi:hypothetical protein